MSAGLNEFSGVGRKSQPIDLILVMGFFRLFDIIIPLIAGYFYYVTYSRFFEIPYWPIYGRFALVGAVLSAMICQLSGCYQTDSLRNSFVPLKRLSASFLWLLALGLTLAFLCKALNDISRVWTLLWLSTWFATVAALRMIGSWLIVSRTRSGHLTKTVAIVGATSWAETLCAAFEENSPSVRIVGIFDDRRDRVAEPFSKFVLPLEALLKLGKKIHIDRVVVTLPLDAESRILDITDRLMALSVQIVACPDLSRFNLLRRPISCPTGIPEIAIIERPMADVDFLLKILADKVIAFLLLVFLTPVLAVIALGVKLTSPGPILFLQTRLGYNNDEFKVLKFRSMRNDLGDAAGGRQAKRNDSRLTPIGRFLRQSSLDELPQLLNVLRGEMSLVGPRPLPIGMLTLDKYNHEIVDRYAHRHRVRPGITGWAQVNGCRGATVQPSELQKRVQLDLYYIENWSLAFDVKILFLTGVHLFHAKNAF